MSDLSEIKPSSLRHFQFHSITSADDSSLIHPPHIAPGRYSGKTGMHAARKVFCKICKLSGVEDTYECVFTIQETTVGSEGKIYRYIGMRSKLVEPKKIRVGDKEITLTTVNKIYEIGD